MFENPMMAHGLIWNKPFYDARQETGTGRLLLSEAI